MGKIQPLVTMLHAYWPVLAPVVAYFVLDFANGLMKYSVKRSFARALIDTISTHSNADSPNTRKLPGKRSKPPAGAAEAPAAPAAEAPAEAKS